MNWYFIVLKKFARYKGRARRNEFWNYLLISALILILLTLFLPLVGLAPPIVHIIIQIFLILNVAPFLAVLVRRLHDVGKSGWFMFVPAYNIILSISQGEIGENKYGKDPKRYSPKRKNLQ